MEVSTQRRLEAMLIEHAERLATDRLFDTAWGAICRLLESEGYVSEATMTRLYRLKVTGMGIK